VMQKRVWQSIATNTFLPFTLMTCTNHCQYSRPLVSAIDSAMVVLGAGSMGEIILPFLVQLKNSAAALVQLNISTTCP
jgi:hypothetical protein